MVILGDRFIIIACSFEGSEFTVTVPNDTLSVLHVSEIVDGQAIDEVRYMDKDGGTVFRAECEGNPDSPSCKWDVYSVGMDAFSEFAFTFHGELHTLVGAFQMVDFVLANYAPTAPSAVIENDDEDDDTEDHSGIAAFFVG